MKATMRTIVETRHRCDGLTVLGAFWAHQLLGVAILGVDVAHNPARRPVDEPGRQQSTDQQQRDGHTALEYPDASVACPQVAPPRGY
jgi:hypothetical protein